MVILPPCRFGCKNESVGLFWFSKGVGCICWPDHVQSLCAQHAFKAKQNNDDVVELLPQS